jgi:hypothetical protein
VQDDLAKLSTNTDHRLLPNAEHADLTGDEEFAAVSAQAIRDVVEAVRTGKPLSP